MLGLKCCHFSRYDKHLDTGVTILYSSRLKQCNFSRYDTSTQQQRYCIILGLKRCNFSRYYKYFITTATILYTTRLKWCNFSQYENISKQEPRHCTVLGVKWCNFSRYDKYLDSGTTILYNAKDGMMQFFTMSYNTSIHDALSHDMKNVSIKDAILTIRLISHKTHDTILVAEIMQFLTTR